MKILFVILFLCLGLGRSEGAEVLVLFALEGDVESFSEGLEELGFEGRVEEGEKGYHGKFPMGEVRVRVALMGRGCVQSALTVERLVRARRPEFVLSVGPAGGLDAGVPVGSWHRIEGIVAYQSSAVEGMEVVEPGWVATTGLAWFRELPGGKTASGERFIKSAEEARRLQAETGCALVEMNLFGVLTVLEEAEIPSLHLRVVSDSADENAGADFAKFREASAGEGGARALRILQSIPNERDDPGSPEGYEYLRELLEEKKEE